MSVEAETACSVTPTNSTNLGSGCLYAKQNGFVNQGNQIVTMQAGSGRLPINGVVADYWIIATVGENIPQLFSAVLGSPWAKVRARSVAAVYKPPIGACIYALGSTGVGLRVTGTVNVYSTCGNVNSSDPSAFTGGGSSVINATKISVVGGYDPNGGTSVTPRRLPALPRRLILWRAWHSRWSRTGATPMVSARTVTLRCRRTESS